jgi:transcriptional regulator with XRE-family HTH domain
MSVERWSEYVRDVAGELNQLQIAAKTGLAQTNIGRWLRGEPGAPRADTVIAFARAFDQPAVEALLAAGYLTVEEAQAKARTPLSEFSVHELIAELDRRFPG